MDEKLPVFEYDVLPIHFECPLSLWDWFKTNYEKYFKIEDEKCTGGKWVFGLKAKHYVGIIKIPFYHQPILIKPKKGNEKTLFSLLKYSEIDPFFPYDEIINSFSPDQRFFDVIIEKFLENLQSLKLFKSYKSKFLRTDSPHGKILLDDLVHNPEFYFGKIKCECDDFTLDIIENQIIKSALINLCNIDDPSIVKQNQRQLINNFLHIFQKVTVKKITDINLRKVRYNRLNFGYKKIHSYCQFIINHLSFGVHSGVEAGFSFLINSWDTFEKSVRNIITKNLSPEFQTWKGYSTEPLQIEELDESNSFLKLIPDIVVYRKNGLDICLICDVKYKLTPEIGDFHQSNSYINLTKAKYLTHFEEKNRRILLIYPKNIGDPDIEISLWPKDHSKSVYRYFIDLTKLGKEDYISNWVEKIRKFIN